MRLGLSFKLSSLFFLPNKGQTLELMQSNFARLFVKGLKDKRFKDKRFRDKRYNWPWDGAKSKFSRKKTKRQRKRRKPTVSDPAKDLEQRLSIIRLINPEYLNRIKPEYFNGSMTTAMSMTSSNGNIFNTEPTVQRHERQIHIEQLPIQGETDGLFGLKTTQIWISAVAIISLVVGYVAMKYTFSGEQKRMEEQKNSSLKDGKELENTDKTKETVAVT